MDIDKQIDEILGNFAIANSDLEQSESFKDAAHANKLIIAAHAQLKALYSTAVGVGREQGFMGCKAAFSYNAGCAWCEANRLTLNFMAEPTPQLKDIGEKK